MTHTDLLRQALDALETLDEWLTNDMAPDSVLESASLKFEAAITALRAALAAPVEPLDGFGGNLDSAPAAPAVLEPLTDRQFADMVADASIAVDLAASPLKLLAFARAILAAQPAQVPDPWRMAVDAAMVGYALDCTTPDSDPKQCVDLLCKQVADIWRDISQPAQVPVPLNCIEDDARGLRLVGPHGGVMSDIPNPTDAELASPLFEAIWQATKTWDVNVPKYYKGYCGMNGSHVVMILRGIAASQEATKP